MQPNNEHQECTNKKSFKLFKKKKNMFMIQLQPALLKQVPTKLDMKLLLVKVENELHILLPICKKL